jgi:hypothetical protein
MKFVGYMLYVLILTMCRSYAHEKEIFVKMLHFDHVYVTCIYVPTYLVGDACAKIVAILLVFVSILACYSARCIFEKHMLAFVELIHALPTRGGEVPNSCFREFCIKGRKTGRNAFVQGSLHSCISELPFT